MLRQYVRNAKNDKSGVMVAFKDGNKCMVGFSFCREKMDEFNKDLGEKIAIGRALKLSDAEAVNEDMIPFYASEQAANFVGRCKKYFKDCELPSWIK